MSNTDKSWFDAIEKSIPHIDNEDLVRVAKMFVDELGKRNIDLNHNEINNTVKIVIKNYVDVVLLATSYNFEKILNLVDRFIKYKPNSELIRYKMEDKFIIKIYSEKNQNDSEFMSAEKLSHLLTREFENYGIIVYSDSTITK